MDIAGGLYMFCFSLYALNDAQESVIQPAQCERNPPQTLDHHHRMPRSLSSLCFTGHREYTIQLYFLCGC